MMHKEGFSLDQKIKKGLKIFYAVSLITAALILYFTSSPATLNSLVSANPLLLLLALLLAISVAVVDNLRLRLLVAGLGEKLTFAFGLELVFANNFFSAITPFATGGGALQVYMMHERGITIAKGMASTVMKFILSIVFLGISSPLLLLAFPGLVQTANIRYLFLYTTISFGIAAAFYLTVLFWPWATQSLVRLFLSILQRIRLIHAERAERWQEKILHIIQEFSTSFKSYFGRGKVYILLGFLCTVLLFLIQFTIPVILMWAFHQKVDVIPVIANQLVLMAVMYFVPTPGSSGVAEGGFALIFMKFIPKHILGLLVIFWRFLTSYMGVILGSYIFLKILGNVTMKTIMNVTDQTPDIPEKLEPPQRDHHELHK